MKRYLEDRRSLDSVSPGKLREELTNALTFLHRVYCIIDELDETDIDEHAFIDKFVELGKQDRSSIKVLLTSRPLPRLESVLRSPSVLQIRLERQFVDLDIAAYIDHRLQTQEALDNTLYYAVKHAILEKAQGSFLYSRLMMDESLIGFPLYTVGHQIFAKLT